MSYITSCVKNQLVFAIISVKCMEAWGGGQFHFAYYADVRSIAQGELCRYQASNKFSSLIE